jgi:lipopolysaccharide core heptose(I) kinase
MNLKTKSLDNKKLTINSDFIELLKFNGIDSASKLWNIEGEAVKKILAQRGTERAFLDTPDGGKLEVYIKRYTKIPLKEKIKQAFSLKFDSFDAVHEWNALRAFHKLGLDTMVPMAVAELGNGQTCNLTLGITDYIKAAELFKNFSSEDCERKTSLIKKIATIAGRMHVAGLAHQDFYLVHMFVRESEEDKIYLIDLQRLIMQKKLSKRWRVKDLGQLLFAACDYVSDTDIQNFWEVYCSYAGENFYKDNSLIKAIKNKAENITNRDARKGREK